MSTAPSLEPSRSYWHRFRFCSWVLLCALIVQALSPVMSAEAAVATPVSEIVQLPDATLGEPYQYRLPSAVLANLVIDHDALPLGLTLSADGTISGVPVNGGGYTFASRAVSGGGSYVPLTLRVNHAAVPAPQECSTANIALGAPASASSIAASDSALNYDPNNALDDDSSTYWSPSAGSGAGWLMADLGAATPFNQLRLLSNADDLRYDIQGSNDEDAWTRLAVKRVQSNGNQLTLDVGDVRWRYVRVSGHPSAEGGDFALADLAIFHHCSDTSASEASIQQAAPQQVTGISFTFPTDLATNGGPNHIASADFNGDGLGDIVGSNETSAQSLSVWLSTSQPGATTPTFSQRTELATPGIVITLITADLNGDSKPDVLASTGNGKNMFMWLNTTAANASAPSFASPVAIAVENRDVAFITTADFNGDGRQDIAFSSYQGGNGSSISVLLNQGGAPSFSAPLSFTTPTGPGGISAADINGDELPDLTVNNKSGSFSVFLNTGSTAFSFGARTDITSNGPGLGLAAADMNRDERIDLVVNYQNGSSDSRVYLNTTPIGATTPSFGQGTNVGAGSNANCFTDVADFNRDGAPDVVACTSGAVINLYANTTPAGASTFTFVNAGGFSDSGGGGPITIVDVNGDSKPDIARSNRGTTTIGVRINTSAVNSGAPYRDVENVRVWADSFTQSGGQNVATGNVGLGSTSSSTPMYLVGTSVTWSDTSPLNIEGELHFAAAATTTRAVSTQAATKGVSLAKGGFTLNRSTGKLTFKASGQVTLNRLGKSKLALDNPNLDINVLQPKVKVDTNVALNLPENKNKTVAASYQIDDDGDVSDAETKPATLQLAGGKLNVTLTPSDVGLVAENSQIELKNMSLPDTGPLTIDGEGSTGMRFGSSASFRIPDLSLGKSGVLKLTGMQATLAVDNVDGYKIDVSATVIVTKVKTKGGGDNLTVAGTLTIAKGRLDGTINTLAFTMQGVEFNATNMKLVDSKLAVETATLTLPIKGEQSVSATVYGLELGGDTGFRFQGAKISLPDFKIGKVGVQGASIEFKDEGNYTYTIAGAAKFAFTKFDVDGAFKIALSSSGVSLRSISLSFQGSVPAPAIPLGNTGFYIVRVAGSFDLSDGTVTISLGLGAASAVQVGATNLLQIDGSITLTLNPFSIETSASAKVVGYQVASVNVRITSSSFSLKGQIRVSVIQASLEVTFGKDINNEFTFYGNVKADIIIPEGYFVDKWFVTIPSDDYKIASASLEGGKFRHNNDVIWGARGSASVFGFDFYAWAKFGPGSGDYGIGRKLKDYEPVRPRNVAAQRAANGDVYQVAVTEPADHLIVVEGIVPANRSAPQEITIIGPNGVAFTKTLAHEEPDKSARVYRIEFANPNSAIGTWTMITHTGNYVDMDAATPHPVLDSFKVCIDSANCLSGNQSTTRAAQTSAVGNNQQISVSWQGSGYEPGLTLDVYAENASGMRYPIARQESSTKTLSGSQNWTLGLPSGTYTVTAQIESDGFAPTVVDAGTITVNDTTPPAAPANLAASVDAAMAATATWNGAAAEADVAGYRVSVDGGPAIETDGRLTSFTSYGLAPGKVHTISIAAYDMSGNVGSAASVKVTAPAFGLSAAWPRNNSQQIAVPELGGSFSTPVTAPSITLVGSTGAPVGGAVSPLTGELSVDRAVTWGAAFTPANPLQPGNYTATISANHAATGALITYQWKFSVAVSAPVAPTPLQVFLPMVRR